MCVRRRRVPASDGQVAWVNHTTLLCPALRLELTLGALPSDAWQPLRLLCGVLACWFNAGLRLGGRGLAACNTLARKKKAASLSTRLEKARGPTPAAAAPRSRALGNAENEPQAPREAEIPKDDSGSYKHYTHKEGRS